MINLIVDFVELFCLGKAALSNCIVKIFKWVLALKLADHALFELFKGKLVYFVANHFVKLSQNMVESLQLVRLIYEVLFEFGQLRHTPSVQIFQIVVLSEPLEMAPDAGAIFVWQLFPHLGAKGAKFIRKLLQFLFNLIFQVCHLIFSLGATDFNPPNRIVNVPLLLLHLHHHRFVILLHLFPRVLPLLL